MLNILADSHSTSTTNAMDTGELLRILGRFPSPVLPIGVLRELQSRGDSIHDSLVTIIRNAIDSVGEGLGRGSNAVAFAFAMLVPISTNDDRPLIESVLKLPDKTIHFLFGDMVNEAMPRMVANFFNGQNASEVIDWIDRLADHPKVSSLSASSLCRSIAIAVVMDYLDRNTAINALVNRLKKRADKRDDFQSANLVCELIDLSSRSLEEVDTVVRSCFDRDQIDRDVVEIESWDDLGTRAEHSDNRSTWSDPVEVLSSWCYEYVCDSLDPVNTTFRVNEQASRFFSLSESSVHSLIDQLRKSTDDHFPRDAVQSIGNAFADAYHATIDLIREEVARYQNDSDSWSGNGAYLGLVLTIAKRMPLPTDLLEAILRMPQTDREQLLGDQFGLIVQTVALTPLHQHDFIDQWIWDVERSDPDRRTMVDYYVHACQNNTVDREVAINALVSGLRRALFEEPLLIAPFAENLAFLTPTMHSQVLEEAFIRDDVEWFSPLQDLRRMVHDAEFAKVQYREFSQSYRTVTQMISDGVMFSPAELQEEPLARVFQPQPVFQKSPEVLSTTTIRGEIRTPRNAQCPCGSGKKFKKCCLNK